MVTDVIRLLLFPALMAFAASSDLLTMTISNRLSLALAGGFFLLMIVTGMSLHAAGMHVAAAAIVLVVAFVFFSQGWIGGGDAKLAAATALWFGFDYLLDYLIYASLFGGALTLAIIQFRKIPLPAMLARQGWILRLHALQRADTARRERVPDRPGWYSRRCAGDLRPVLVTGCQGGRPGYRGRRRQGRRWRFDRGTQYRMSIEAAFRKVSNEVGTQSVALAEELTLTTAELSYLPDRRQAYENLAKRTDLDGVKSVCMALQQSERYGTPLATMLRVMAQENRDMRMSEAEKKAAGLPPKLTVPMILFFLPVLFVVILGPAVIKVMALQ